MKGIIKDVLQVAKISEDQVSNKRKYRSAKKKAVESKVKKNAGRNKKKV